MKRRMNGTCFLKSEEEELKIALLVNVYLELYQ